LRRRSINPKEIMYRLRRGHLKPMWQYFLEFRFGEDKKCERKTKG
jgi:hypothetical protein